MKIMKELVWINIIFFLNLAFGQVDEKNSGKDWIIEIQMYYSIYWISWHLKLKEVKTAGILGIVPLLQGKTWSFIL